MACLICDRSGYTRQRSVSAPDRYERYQGIAGVKREWRRCRYCQFLYQTRNYPLAKLEAIYLKGYRDKAFRGVTVRQAYNQVYTLPKPQSESWQRAQWFAAQFKGAQTVLDVGAGLGIFPTHLRDLGYDVACTEQNAHSLRWIRHRLKFECFEEIPARPFDVVSLVHVLEHVEKPDGFLKAMPARRLFIEVPDGSRINELADDHDDLNSCHLWAFDFHTLEILLNRNGYRVTAANRVTYDQRSLYRLRMAAECI